MAPEAAQGMKWEENEMGPIEVIEWWPALWGLVGQGLRPVWEVRVKVRAGPGEQQAGLRRGRDADLGGVRPGGGRRRASPIRVVRGAGDVWQAEEAVEGTVAWRVAPAACRAVSQPTPLTSFHIAECVTSCAVKVKVPGQRCKLREHGRGPGR